MSVVITSYVARMLDMVLKQQNKTEFIVLLILNFSIIDSM